MLPCAERLRLACERKPHGTVARYVGGCRCFPCGLANRRYQDERRAARLAGDFRGLVGTERVLEHLRFLSRQGVGYHSVADAASVNYRNLSDIMAGRRRHIRADAERRILAVDVEARSGFAKVPSGPTLRLIAELLEDGYTEAQLALWLGSKSPTPRLWIRHEQITWAKATAVEKLYRMLRAGRIERSGGPS